MSGEDYKFMQIVDAISRVNQRVNLIGVAIETSLPRTTRGTDYFCLVRIVDDSWRSGVKIHFFAETMENLPLIESVGNIVLVTNVVIKTLGHGVYAVYNKMFSSFALFEGRGSTTNELVPFQISPSYQPRYKYSSYFIMLLRNWTLSARNEDLRNSTFLRDIEQDEHVNLLCKILHVAQFNEDEWMLFVWDGTDAPPLSVESELENELENPLPLVLEPTPLSRGILCTFPTAGTVLRMTVDQGYAKLGLKFLKANRWVKFIDVSCEAHVSLWHAVLTPFSKLCYLPDDEEFVKQCQRSYEERIKPKWGKVPLTSFPWPSSVTETDHPDVPFLTLMDVLTYPKVTSKFKCVVRVVAVVPWATELFRSPAGIYRVRVTLEDPTARIHAYLYDDDGVKFFGSSLSADVLARKRNLLLGVAGEDAGNVTRNPPWIQCCLTSYYIDKNDVWGSRNYRIFDTTCVG